MQKNINPVDVHSREYLEKTAAGGRYALLMVMVFTVVNLVVILLGAGRFFLFSASVPYYMTLLAKGYDNGFVAGSWNVNGRYTTAALLISVGILTAYLICWFLSEKRRGWLIAALALFSLDTMALVAISFLLMDGPMSCIFDLFIHGWALWQMSAGVKAYGELEKRKGTA